jgi:hypothetical protein
MGHGAALHVETYAHVIDGMGGQRYDGLDDVIVAARVLPEPSPADLTFPSSSPSAAGSD